MYILFSNSLLTVNLFRFILRLEGVQHLQDAPPFVFLITCIHMHVPYFFSQVSGEINGQIASSGIIADAAFERLGELIYASYSREKQIASGYVTL